MSIKIEIEAANGADARQQMLDLLGINSGASSDIIAFQLQNQKQQTEKLKEQAGAYASDIIARLEENTNEEKPAEEQPKTRKRRTQAEIQKDALAANTGTEEPPASTENVTEEVSDMAQTMLQDNAEQNGEKLEQAITAEMLTAKAVELGRAGKRDAVLATLEQQFGGATIAKKDGKPQLQPEQYQAVMDAFNAIA